MGLHLQSACISNIGKLRANNEDNFLFDNKCLEVENHGLRKPVFYKKAIHNAPVCQAVFDGMGGEDYGELAAFVAAQSMKLSITRLSDYAVPERQFLNASCFAMNRAVFSMAQELGTSHMGTTVVILLFSGHDVYSCNLGDSKAFRLRNGEFMQLTEDHSDAGHTSGQKVCRKPPLTQYLGMNPEEIRIEPHIAKGMVLPGDQYLICSDGLTDMLTNAEICGVMSSSRTVEACADELVLRALQRGGRDNITVIISRVL